MITIKHAKGASTHTKQQPCFKYRTRGKEIICRARAAVKATRKDHAGAKSGNSRSWSTPKVEEAWEKKLATSSDFIKAKREGALQVDIDKKRDEFKQATRDYHVVAEEARLAAWRQFCEQSDPGDPKVISKF